MYTNIIRKYLATASHEFAVSLCVLKKYFRLLKTTIYKWAAFSTLKRNPVDTTFVLSR